MPRFNPNSSFSSETLRSDTLRSSRSPSLAAYAGPHQGESSLGLLTSPLNPDPRRYGPLQMLSPSPAPSTAEPSYQYSPILPMTPSPSRPVTRSSIPRDCFEEFVIPPRYKDKKPDRAKWDMWGGPISFYPIEVSSNKGALGTPMRDCLEGFGLKEPEERLFESLASAGKSHIEFVIMWPGYPQLDWIVPISIYGSDSLLVTKREFAYRIAIQYQNFALMCELNQLECQDPRWRIGPGGYTLDRMRLSVIRWVDEDVWQAHIRVLTDRDVDPNGLKPMRDISHG